MKQKLEDLKLMIQGSRKAKLIIAFGVIAVLLTLVFDSKPKRQMVRAVEKPEENLVTSNETPQDMLYQFRTELGKIKEDTATMNRALIETKQQQTEQQERVAEIMRRMIERIEVAESKSSVSSAMVPQEIAEMDGGVDVGNENGFDDETLEPFGEEEMPIMGEAEPPQRKIAFIGAGDSVRVKLLSGVNAPTDGTPYPVVLSLIGDVHGPDGSTLPLGEGRLIAAAQGSLTDSRALFRLTSLNLRFPSGRRQVYEVDGWVVGEDGVRGLSGILHDPAGEAIGWSAVIGGIQGVGRGLQAANQRVIGNNNGGYSIIADGNLGQFAAGSAASGAAQEVSQILRNRISQMVPVVEVLSNREATAVFAQNLAIEGLYDELDGDYGNMAGLD